MLSGRDGMHEDVDMVLLVLEGLYEDAAIEEERLRLAACSAMMGSG